jgi:Protein of unknown function (DUF1064)
MSKSSRLALPNIGNRTTLTAQEFRNMQNGTQMPVQKTKSKFGAIKCEIEGIRFDSKKESQRYLELELLHKAGLISKPILQYEFLLPGPIKYLSDFVYYDYKELVFVVEDTKGFKTPEYKLKKKLMKAILQIEIKES